MLKMPSPLQSRGSPPIGAWQPPTGAGAGSSPAFRWNFLRRSAIAPPSFHLMPESCTAMTTSGRPVSLRQAISTLMPLTPFSSLALALTSGSLVQALVLAFFHMSPLHPLISFASGTQPSGIPELSQRFGLAGYGKSARAAPAKHSVASAKIVLYGRMVLPSAGGVDSGLRRPKINGQSSGFS